MTEPKTPESSTARSDSEQTYHSDRPGEFQEDVRAVFFRALSNTYPNHDQRYLRDAQYHHTINTVVGAVIAVAVAMREEIDAPWAAIDRVVASVADQFATSAMRNDQMRALAEREWVIKTENLPPLFDKP